MTTLYIARHGNTFDKGDTLLRVGLKTDLALSNSGKEQAILLGKFIKLKNITFDAVFCSNLKRTYETASIVLNTAKQNLKITPNENFNEIDYGVDEAKPEEEVIARIGQDAIDLWNKSAIVPIGWNVNTKKIIEDWKNFAQDIKNKYPNQNVLVVTSNGIARFAPYLTESFELFNKKYDIKLATGAISCLKATNNYWEVLFWNVKPKFIL